MTPLDFSVAICKQNGACDIYTRFDNWIGSLYFVSYGDYFLTTTLSPFDAVTDALYADLRDGVITPEVVTRVIIGAIVSIKGSVLLLGTIVFRNMTGWLTGRGRGRGRGGGRRLWEGRRGTLWTYLLLIFCCT